MPERLMGTDCKSVSIAYAGSNPARPTLNFFIFIIKKRGKIVYNFIYIINISLYKSMVNIVNRYFK